MSCDAVSIEGHNCISDNCTGLVHLCVDGDQWYENSDGETCWASSHDPEDFVNEI